MKVLLFAGTAALAVQLSAQVAAPSAPVTVPPSAVTVPPNPAIAPSPAPGVPSQPGSMINPAVPTAVPPQTAGRTFETTPLRGIAVPPFVNPAVNPNTVAPPLGFPPVVGTNGAVTVTNTGVAGPFSQAVTGFGLDPVRPGLVTPRPQDVAPVTGALQPFQNPAGDPFTVNNFPPGTAIRGTPTTSDLGQTPTAPQAVGAPPSVNRGSAASPPPVVRPQR